MVAALSDKARRRKGRSRVGRLFVLLILVTAAYYGVDIGNTFFKHWQLIQEMKAQAGLALSIDNAAIARRIVRKIESLDLPASARANLSVQRTLRPREIIIKTAYEVEYVLPFTTRSDTLNIEVRSPL